jgi:hypothetical protein
MLRKKSAFLSLSLFNLILCAAIPIFSLAMPFAGPTDNSAPLQSALIRRQGNPQVAGDIYGVGLRVGAYLQIAGMLLSCVRTENRSRSGILLLSSSVCISLFIALTVLISRHTISPCEAWLILSLTAAYGVPRFCALNEKDHPTGGIATLLCLISLLWQHVLYFWFWTIQYRQLPLLGTENRVWFFAPVDIGGWFRIFMLAATCIDSIMTVGSIGAYINLMVLRFVNWAGAEPADHGVRATGEEKLSKSNLWDKAVLKAGRRVDGLREKPYYINFVHFGRIVVRLSESLIGRRRRDDPEIPAETQQDDIEVVRNQLRAKKAERKLLGEKLRKRKLIMMGLGFVVLVFTIAGVEKIIEYNSLSPTSDLSTPGQIIPFILGIITLIIGVTHAIKPYEDTTSAKTRSMTSGQPVSSSMIGIPEDDNIQWIDLTPRLRAKPEEESLSSGGEPKV